MGNLSITRILNDADTWKYKACFAAKSKYDGEDDPPFNLAVMCFQRFVESQYNFISASTGKTIDIEKWIGEGKISSYLTSSDKSNFRFKAATILEYKGNRKESDKPPHLDNLTDYIKRTWKAETVEGMEADDKMGIESAKNPENTLLNHEDKDLWQLEGWHCWYDGNRATTRRMMYVEHPGVVIMERSASGTLQLFTTGLYRLQYQLLAGDKSDNIPKVVKEVKGSREFGYSDLDIYEMFKGETIKAVEGKVWDIFNKHYGDGADDRYKEIYKLVKILDKPL